MNNNDILRRLRYTLKYSDSQMQDVFEGTGQNPDRVTIRRWLKRPDEEGFKPLTNHSLISFLDGLILQKRGPKDGPEVKPEKLSNNLILKKLKIAFSLQSNDILALLAAKRVRLSKHELSAFFRKPGHKHYRECGDQVLNSFLQGLATSRTKK